MRGKAVGEPSEKFDNVTASLEVLDVEDHPRRGNRPGRDGSPANGPLSIRHSPDARVCSLSTPRPLFHTVSLSSFVACGQSRASHRRVLLQTACSSPSWRPSWRPSRSEWHAHRACPPVDHEGAHQPPRCFDQLLPMRDEDRLAGRACAHVLGERAHLVSIERRGEHMHARQGCSASARTL